MEEGYLVAMHERIHPVFSDAFLEWLDTFPTSDPLNNPQLGTVVEIVLTTEGRLVGLGVVRSSGIRSFDVGVLDSIDGAQPFGSPPDRLVSPDGRVYMRWEFRRDPTLACAVDPHRVRPCRAGE
jgi:TonB family protein